MCAPRGLSTSLETRESSLEIRGNPLLIDA
jgi:hypothetical protein